MSRRSDQGFATVAVLALSGVLASVAALVALLSGVAVARHEAASIADLTALAAAGHALEGEAAACRVAAELARAQRADVARCGLDGLDALVEIVLRPAGALGRWGSVRATARAGRRAEQGTVRCFGPSDVVPRPTVSRRPRPNAPVRTSCESAPPPPVRRNLDRVASLPLAGPAPPTGTPEPTP